MAQLTPIQILEELTRQMREDQHVDAEMQAIAAMSDAELDAELRSYGRDPSQLEKQALAIYDKSLSPNHQYRASLLMNFARLLVDRGNPAEAGCDRFRRRTGKGS